MYFLNLTLGIWLKEMVLYYSMKIVRSNENKSKIIYSNSMKTNCNELIRRLLSGVTDDELENLVRVREEARRPIRGEEPVKKFMKEMLKEVQYCEKIIKTKFKKPLKMSSEDEQNFNAAGKKYIKEDIRVRDHCHITGQYRGSAHEKCNLKLRISSEKFKLPVIFHNLRGYDSHFIMQEIGTIGKEYELYINCIPNNMEEYMAFMLGKHLVFLDSFQFMSSSLDRLSANLPKDKFKYTSKVFKKEKLELMTQKGVYPYDYMDSFERFNETQLPSKDPANPRCHNR